MRFGFVVTNVWNSGAAEAAVRDWLARARRPHLHCDALGYAGALVRRVAEAGS